MLLIFSWFIVYIFVSYNLFGVKKKRKRKKKTWYESKDILGKINNSNKIPRNKSSIGISYSHDSY